MTQVRGRGLLLGVELDTEERALELVRRALHSGWLLLPSGSPARVVYLSPPFIIDPALLDAGLDQLVELLK